MNDIVRSSQRQVICLVTLQLFQLFCSSILVMICRKRLWISLFLVNLKYQGCEISGNELFSGCLSMISRTDSEQLLLVNTLSGYVRIQRSTQPKKNHFIDSVAKMYTQKPIFLTCITHPLLNFTGGVCFQLRLMTVYSRPAWCYFLE